MNFLAKAILPFLLATGATAVDADTKMTIPLSKHTPDGRRAVEIPEGIVAATGKKPQSLGEASSRSSGTFKVPSFSGETKGLRGSSSSGSYITVKSQGSGSPSMKSMESFVASVAPKKAGGEKKKKKASSSTIRTIPKTGTRSSGIVVGCSEPDDNGGNGSGGAGGSNCGTESATVLLSFSADSYASLENSLFLFDSSTLLGDGSFSEDPVWNYNVGSLTDGQQYDLLECLDENVCWTFIFIGVYD
jgi:hypothetical protein